MLEIQRNDVEAGRVVLVLRGQIVAEWADVLGRECRKSRRSGRRVALDLSEVTSVGRAGLEVLGRLGRAGVAIGGCSPSIADMLEWEGLDVGRAVRSAA